MYKTFDWAMPALVLMSVILVVSITSRFTDVGMKGILLILCVSMIGSIRHIIMCWKTYIGRALT